MARPACSGADSEDDGNSPIEQTADQAAAAQAADSEWEPKEHPANRAILSREDLDRHFGYGLNEAARRLGVCKTTLKRACRLTDCANWIHLHLQNQHSNLMKQKM